MKKITSHFYSSESIYIVGILTADTINFLFNVFLGRSLAFEDFGLIALLSALSYVGNIILSALSSTLIHKVSYLLGKGEMQKISAFFYMVRSFIYKANVAYILLGLVSIIPLSRFFDIDSYLPILLFLPVLPCGLINSMNKALLTGRLHFRSVGILTILEAVIKFFVAVLFVFFKAPAYAYIAIPFSIISISILSSFFINKSLHPKENVSQKLTFPRKFFIAALITGFSTSAFLALDVLVAKHYLSKILAGEYALLALMGKIIYFCGSLLNALIIAFSSHSFGKGNSKSTISRHLFITSLLLTSIPYVAIGLFGRWTLPYFFGSKTYVILPYLSVYSLAIALFTISIQIVSYYLAKKLYLFSVMTFISYLIMIISIMFIHRTIWDIIYVMFYSSVLQFILVLSLHVLKDRLFYRNE